MTIDERQQWLEARRNGIGSSDVPAVLGISPWKTALDVYLAKINTAPATEGLSGPQEWGLRMEPVIAAAAMDHYGWTVEKVPTLRHREHDWLIASPDRANQDGELLEIKTSARADGWGQPETADIPQHYWIQVQHQLEVADRPVAWVLALIGGNDFRRYRIERDAGYMPTVFEPLREFWQCVENRTPPEIDWENPPSISALNRLFEPKPGTFTVLDDDAERLADEYAALGEAEKEAKEARELCKSKLIVALGEHAEGLLTDGRRISRKTVERKGYTVEPSSYVDFRILKAKKGNKVMV